jgi:hypothetical protein
VSGSILINKQVTVTGKEHGSNVYVVHTKRNSSHIAAE